MIPPQAAVVSTAESSGIFTVAVSGEVDVDAVGPFEEALATALRSTAHCTIVDISGLTFADSTLLGLLLSTKAAHEDAGRPLAIAGPLRPWATRLFTVTGTAEFLPLADDLDAARQLAGCVGS
ncbi:STAS domain-containing protein [Streptomyces lonarensis]|uniref:STAS domain-containing protein n=1 Tax=Streptomyces lonarensis TaxID=700599 RepID=A0A7X6CZE6_9ACTN|nr:STAS domain-containing protein [Streptomyces lonarensis]NJQ05364.1 STAS domain-containing protein [Streptomyces lonarensis]